MNIKDHISERKGSITQLPSYRNLVTEDLGKVSILYADMKQEVSFYQNSDHLENIDFLEAERGQYTILKFQLRMCETSVVGRLQHGVSNRCEKQAFFNYFHSKVFFLILVNVCFTFRKYVTKFECLCKYSNHSFVFLNREYIFCSVHIQKILEGILYFLLLLRNKSHVLIWIIVVKIEM